VCVCLFLSVCLCLCVYLSLYVCVSECVSQYVCLYVVKDATSVAGAREFLRHPNGQVGGRACNVVSSTPAGPVQRE